MKMILEGLPLSGKTTRLIEKYHDLIRQGIPTNHILVLVANIRDVKKWHEAIDLPVTGKLQIFTYWSFIQRELVGYWHLALPNSGEHPQPVKPTFLNAEAAHFLMNLLVESKRRQGGFSELVATSSQIALQILNNLNQAAINGIGIDEVTERLLRTCAGMTDKENALHNALELAVDFREYCLKGYCLDYSLCVDLFSKQILRSSGYREGLMKRFTHLLIDNLEESIPAEVDLIMAMVPFVTPYLVCDPSGGHTRSFGADPEYARESLYPLCQVEILNNAYGCSEDAATLAATISPDLTKGRARTVKSSAINKSIIDCEFRADMIARVTADVINLLNKGCHPRSIAVIAPSIDKVLEYTLTRDIRCAGNSVQNISQRQYLISEPFAQIMVCVASFILPEAGMVFSRSSLASCFQIIFGLDPIRSSLLAHHCLVGGELHLPDLDETGLRERIGFNAGAIFDSLKCWVGKISAERPAPGSLFQSIFTDILARVIDDPNDIAATRQTIASSIKFNEVYQSLPVLRQESFASRFLELISKGTIAAEKLFGKDLQDDAVVLATPLAAIRSGLSFQYQFWLDCTDTGWFLRDFRELSNSAITRKNWNGEWNETIERKLKLDNAARTFAGLLYRCQGNITLASSEHNNIGHRLDGTLPEVIYEGAVDI